MKSYRVQAGDTLGKIARKFYGSASRFLPIVMANHITNPDRLKVGQTLMIPDTDAVTGSDDDGPPALVSPRILELNEGRLGALHPELAARGRVMVQRCARSGVAILISQGLRTFKEQDALYAQGRTKPPIGPKHVVTKARGGQSWHNFGLAFDIVVLDAVGKANWNTKHAGWAKAAEIGKGLGLAWGGDWRGFKDIPHFEYTGDLTLAACRELHASGLEDIWSQLA